MPPSERYLIQAQEETRMKKLLLPGTAAVAVLLAIAGGAFAFGAFDGDDSGPSAGPAAESACLAGSEDCADNPAAGDTCLAGSEDCADNPGAGDDGVAGMCAPGYPDCVDTVVDQDGDTGEGVDGGPMNMCIEGTVDCNDVVAVDPDQPTSDRAGEADEPPPNAGCATDPRLCEDLAVESVYAALEEMGGPADVEFLTVEYTEWPNACLGVEQPGVVCAEVITPGFLVVLTAGQTTYEFHTDTTGRAVLAE
jgi:hypothetical protein